MISMSAAIAALNAITAKLNVGGSPGTIKIYSGSAPASLAASATGTLLSSANTLSTTAFPTAIDGGTNGLATANANTITGDTSAAASGTAGYFRACDSAGVAVFQGTAGTAGTDLVLTSAAITAGGPVVISSWTVTLPDGSGVD
jgi:hypothetical protein